MSETSVAYPVVIVLFGWLLLVHVAEIASFALALATMASLQLRERVGQVVAAWRRFREELKRWREL
jgi:hypothetical protein